MNNFFCFQSQVLAPDISSIIAQVMEVDNTAIDQDQNHNVSSNRELLSVNVERLSVDVVKFYSKNKVLSLLIYRMKLIISILSPIKREYKFFWTFLDYNIHTVSKVRGPVL